jgi:pimeloyl-ACP methyl ester carboxylesterase
MLTPSSSPFSLPSFDQLTEEASRVLAGQIEQVAIDTPLTEEAIATTFVHQGQGEPPLLLLHGFDSSVMEFRRLLPRLAAHRETWAIDLLGFGFTDRPASVPISPDTIKTHLHSTWKALIDRPVVLVGASMGGAVALDFALAFPAAVHQLVLLDSAGYTVGPPLGKYLPPLLAYLSTEILRQPNIRQRISRSAYHNKSLATEDALRCTQLHLTRPRWRAALASFTRSGGYPSLRAQLGQITCPTLILWGRSDQILGTQDAIAFHHAIPHSRLVWLAECGHVPHLEQPHQTAAEIVEFITQTP